MAVKIMDGPFEQFAHSLQMVTMHVCVKHQKDITLDNCIVIFPFLSVP